MQTFQIFRLYKSAYAVCSSSFAFRMSGSSGLILFFFLISFCEISVANFRSCQVDIYQTRRENRIPSILTESYCLANGEPCGPYHKVLRKYNKYIFTHNFVILYQCGQRMNILEVAYIKGDRVVHKRNMTLGAGCDCIDQRSLGGSRRIGIQNMPIEI